MSYSVVPENSWESRARYWWIIENSVLALLWHKILTLLLLIVHSIPSTYLNCWVKETGFQRFFFFKSWSYLQYQKLRLRTKNCCLLEARPDYLAISRPAWDIVGEPVSINHPSPQLGIVILPCIYRHGHLCCLFFTQFLLSLPSSASAFCLFSSYQGVQLILLIFCGTVS